MTVQVKVFEADNTTEVANLTTARQVRNASGRDTLVGVGDGEVAVDYDHPEVAELTGSRIVQVHDGARVPLAFTIDRKREVLVPASGGDANRIVTVSGETLRGRLAKGRVLPWLPVASEGVTGARPITRRRVFNAAAPTIDLTSWTAPFIQDRSTSTYARPRGWPSPYAQWLWGQADTETHPAGWCWFRRTFTLTVDAIVVFLVTADDVFVDYLQAAELQREEPDYPAQVWYDPYRSAVSLAAGTYHYTVAARNDAADGPGAMMAEAWISGADGLDTMLFMSGLADEGLFGGDYDFLYGEGSEAWECLAYPEIGDAGYGHTVGTIMDTLLTEAQARGELPELTWDFTDSLDSDGVAWADLIPEIDFDATGTLADAVDKLEDLGYCDVQVSHSGGLELRLFNGGTRGSTQAITISQAAQNLVSHSVETNYVDVKNDVLLEHDRGLYLMDDDTAIAADGRLPGGVLPVGPIQSPDMLEQIGAAYLAGATEPGESVIVETTPMTAFAAEPGDSCTVEGDVLRIAEIGFEFEPGGELRKVPVFTTPYEEQRKRSERVVDRMVREAGNSVSVSKVIDTGTNIPSGKLAPVKVTSWSWTDSDLLDPEYWDLADEEPVGWQPFPVEETMRITEMLVECQWAEPDGAGGQTQVTTGDTQISLMIDGGPAPVPLIATVDEVGAGDGYASGSQLIYGPALVRKGQTLSVYPIVNGGHVNGSVTIWATEAL